MSDPPQNPSAPPELGWSAGIVALFLRSRLSLLLLIGSILLGVAALVATPREEDPQIVVPVIDVLVEMPGASVTEVERLAAMPLESLLAEIPGVENVYSMSHEGWSLVTVRFLVGEDRERSLTKVAAQIDANRNRVPPGVTGWRVFPVDIDDVPAVTIALFSRTLEPDLLRRIGHAVLSDLRSLPDVGRSEVVGGLRRELRFVLDPARLAAHGLSPLEVVRAIQGTNAALPTSTVTTGNLEVPVRAGPFLTSAADLAGVVVGVGVDAEGRSRPVRAAEVGEIVDGPEEPVVYTRMGFGPGSETVPPGFDRDLEYPSVTLSLAKKKGANAVNVTRSVRARLEELRGTLLPDGVEFRIARDYGFSANEKVNELAKHLAIAVATVVVLLGLSLGWREAWVVALAVPMTLAVTLFADLLFGYTINRVTLFALILSLGLLVDDPIVDVENIYRHFKLRRFPPFDAVLVAVDEIRPPTILATFTVIVSFLPMFFITGMMGPYMAPMAFNVPISMLMSLFVAFTVTPWAAYHALRREYDIPAPAFEIRDSALYRRYGAVLRPLLRSPRRAGILLAGILAVFVGSVSLVPLGLVPVKMLPFANKDDLLFVVDAPEGTTLETTDAILAEIGDLVRGVPEVVDYQTYAGRSSPIDFNGLVRQYFLREGGNVGDVRVNLVPKARRHAGSHEIALRLRPLVDRIADRHGVIVKIVETPPGPPVLATIVAEVRGPENGSYAELVAAARKVRDALASRADVAETDWTVESDRDRLDIEVDREKAALSGVDVADAVQTARLALAGGDAGGLREGIDLEAVPIRVRLPESMRADERDLLAVHVRSRTGGFVPLGEIATTTRVLQEPTIYHKDQKAVVYVTAEPVGVSPVNVILGTDAADRLPPGYSVSWNGEGEWKITLDAFRDLGLAFGAALILIYVLLVAQTGSLGMPVVIMLAIPLTMIGVFPGFWLLNTLFAQPVGAIPNPIFFTATGMIGLIALAGIVVRNSIILIDFIEVLRRGGKSIEDAVVEAGATRLRPILLTAAAALFGAWVIVLDPVFSGLAWSFIFGIFASTGFTLLVIPTVYGLLAGRGAEATGRAGEVPRTTEEEAAS